jgi:phage baseplate assembly protein W
LQYNFPFQFDKRGRTATTVSEEEHIRQLIEQVLFTVQGERVNRPTFGSNLNQVVFAPNSNDIATATQFLVQGALQQWLGDLIQVELVEIKNEDSSLRISVQYTIKRNQQRQFNQFVQQV